METLWVSCGEKYCIFTEAVKFINEGKMASTARLEAVQDDKYFIEMCSECWVGRSSSVFVFSANNMKWTL